MKFIHAEYAVALLSSCTRSINGKTKMGTIYAFIPIGNTKVVKFGKTTSKRGLAGRNYHGLNTVKHVLLERKVENCHDAEKKLLKWAKDSPHFVQRLDYGHEWFETSLDVGKLKEICSAFCGD